MLFLDLKIAVLCLLVGLDGDCRDLLLCVGGDEILGVWGR